MSEQRIRLTTREKLLAKTRAIKVLSYAMQSEAGAANCEKFVEVLGLKTFFPAFMGKVSSASPVWESKLINREKVKRRNSEQHPHLKMKNIYSVSSFHSLRTSNQIHHHVYDY
jgi:hypothetical protein